jgi:hypothetical protein
MSVSARNREVIDNRQPEIEHFQRQLALQTAKEMASFAAPNERTAEKIVKDAETYLGFLQNTRLAYVGKERGNIVHVTHHSDDTITFVSAMPEPEPQTASDADFFAAYERAPEFDR